MEPATCKAVTHPEAEISVPNIKSVDFHLADMGPEWRDEQGLEELNHLGQVPIPVAGLELSFPRSIFRQPLGC